MWRYLLIIPLFILDRLLKILLLPNPSWASGLGGFISLEVNRAMAFSLPMIAWLFYPMASIILVLIFFYWYKNYQNKGKLWWPWSLLLIGAISNMIDRIRYGGVIDIFYIPGLTVFNLSDVYITLAIVYLLIYNLRKKSDKMV